MYVQLKSGYDTDQGPSWISRVHFSESWRSARFRGLTTDGRYSVRQPTVEDDVHLEYEDFLAGATLPGREHG